MDEPLNETLNRIRGGNIDSPWWRNLLYRFSQQYVSPDFLEKPSLQEWLKDDTVTNDLKMIATWRITGTDRDEAELRDLLAQSYSHRTGEALHLAAGPIDVVVAILVAGYIEEIPRDQRALAGIIQTGFSQLDDRLGHLNQSTSPANDPISRLMQTEYAAQELARILALRAFDLTTARVDIQKLHDRLDTGDLSSANDEVRNNVRYWLARLCAGDAETLDIAKKYQLQIRNNDPDTDLSIVDALILLMDGDPDRGIRVLRDRDDPDSRSVLFTLFVRSQGAETALAMFDDKIGDSDAHYFTVLGWKNWACCMAEAGRWEEAARRLAGFDGVWSDMPALAFIEGVVNAQLLLPEESRHLTDGPPLFVGITPNQGEQAEGAHERAKTCFELAQSGLHDIGRSDLERTRTIADWQHWLRLMDPREGNVRDDAFDEIRENLESSHPDVHLMPFAFVFGVMFDRDSLHRHLDGRRKLGGLDDDELRAECILFLLDLHSGEMKCRDFLVYFERHHSRLDTIIPDNFLMAMKIGALIEDNQIERARTLLKEVSGDIHKAEAMRLSAMIDVHAEVDPRKKLEQAYRETGNIIDLRNLIGCLQRADDRESLLPLLEKMVELQRTVANARNLVVCLNGPPFFDHDRVVKFLEANPDLVVQSPDLQYGKAQALFDTGRLSDARELNESLKNTGQQARNVLALDINIAVASGDWELLPEIVEREWPKRDTHDAETLIRLARIAGHQSHSPAKALALARLAADKATNNPHVLSAAFHLHFRFDREEEADPDWLKRAVQHSSTDAGPVWSVDLQAVVTEWMPKQREQLAEIEQHWLAGKIPAGIAASMLNVPLTRLLVQIPEANADLVDRRMSAVVPVISGGRPPTELHEDWIIGLDLTSILVLHYLDLLAFVLDAFPRIRLAPDVMLCLFEEQGRSRFHQPSQVRAGQQVRTLCNLQRLRVADHLGMPPEATTKEVGRMLGALLQAARQDDGRVVCVLPIHRPDSLMKEEADTSVWDDLIVSVPDFCNLLHRKGIISREAHERAQLFLRSQGQSERGRLEASILDRIIYLDGLVLSYLQNAQVLESIAAAGLDLRIHPDVLGKMDGLVKAGELGEELDLKIDEVRHALRSAVESGKARYLPRRPDPEDPAQVHGHKPTFKSLIMSAADCDALCIDDVVTEKSDSAVPIVCILDVLQYLVRKGYINHERHWAARHKLRAGGFVFIPFDEDELTYWLKAASVESGRLAEGAEIRAIRQSLVRSHNLGLAKPAEIFALQIGMPETCMSVIRSLWNDETLAMETAAVLSDWIWRHQAVAMLGDGGHTEREKLRTSVLELVKLALLPFSIDSKDRRAAYADWLDASALQPLRQANSDLIEEALISLCDMIPDLGDEAVHYGHLFLGQLPEALRQYLLARYPERAQLWGFMARRVFTLDTGISITDHDLFGAAKDVFSGVEAVSIRSISGNEVTVNLDAETGSIVLEYPAAESSTRTMMPQLALLSSDPSARTTTLRSMMERFGPTAPDFDHLGHEIELREPEEHELFPVFHEASRGVVAAQDSLLNKFRFGLYFGDEDILPRDIGYFEKFAGPRPQTRDPDLYIREVLIPYRTALLGRDLKRGLDICCLGALRDDLCPGRWMLDFDDDVVWEALSECGADGVPIALLGALDVALYRQHDERFRTYAEKAVAKLCDEEFSRQEGMDTYRLLWTFTRFSFNRINLIENGARQPGFWKRMCAWMQAQFVARALLTVSAAIDVDRVEEWSMSGMALVGTYAELVDAREEPMLLLTERLPPVDLRWEVLGRLVSLRARHSKEGRSVPRTEEIDRALERAQESGNWIKCFFPGPLEGHLRPVVPTPEDLTKILKEAEPDIAVPGSWHLITSASHLHALGEPELANARDAATRIPYSVDEAEIQNYIHACELASIVAKTNRDALLADAVADMVTRICGKISNENGIFMIISIYLQAAAAFEEHDAWRGWLEERFASIASRLSGPPNQAVRIFLEHLDAMETVLPIDSWFHRRARSVASAGAELRP